MPECLEQKLFKEYLRTKPQLKILALSNNDEFSYIESMIDAGANGFVLKNIEPAEMQQSLRTILSDKIYYCNEVSIKIIEVTENKSTQKVQLGKFYQPGNRSFTNDSHGNDQR